MRIKATRRFLGRFSRRDQYGQIPPTKLVPPPLGTWMYLNTLQVCSVAKSCPTLYNPMEQAPLSMGFFQARILESCHFLLQGIFPTQGSNPQLLHLQVDSLLLEPPGKSIQTLLSITLVHFFFFKTVGVHSIILVLDAQLSLHLVIFWKDNILLN